jgi:hypothetical protein
MLFLKGESRDCLITPRFIYQGACLQAPVLLPGSAAGLGPWRLIRPSGGGRHGLRAAHTTVQPRERNRTRGSQVITITPPLRNRIFLTLYTVHAKYSLDCGEQ